MYRKWNIFVYGECQHLVLRISRREDGKASLQIAEVLPEKEDFIIKARFSAEMTGLKDKKPLASKILYEAAKLTWKNRTGRLGEVVELFDDFSGLRAINVGGLPEDAYMNIGFDGVGTKIELAERIAKHDTVAHDLLAMVCDDAVVRGAEPVIVGSILD